MSHVQLHPLLKEVGPYRHLGRASFFSGLQVILVSLKPFASRQTVEPSTIQLDRQHTSHPLSQSFPHLEPGVWYCTKVFA